MPIPKTFERKDWNLDFRSELYKHEFYATDAWAKRRDGLVSPWDDSTRDELRRLRVKLTDCTDLAWPGR